MFRVVACYCFEALDRIDYWRTLARLSVLDWLLGPFPETPEDRAKADAERLRRAFPGFDFGETRTPTERLPVE